MKLYTFEGADLQQVSESAYAVLGDDTVILRTRVLRSGRAPRVEILAARGPHVDAFRHRIAAEPPARREGGRPLMIALVGPAGAGKTTTVAKLAVHPEAFGDWRVGLLTLDTFRAGAVEQVEGYADAAGLPLEVAYHARDVAESLRRLTDNDVILVDTPGASPGAPARVQETIELLDAVRPDEVHLVIPASMRVDVATAAEEALLRADLTHLLVTKVDETPDDAGLLELAAALDLPTRWLTDGQEIPLDLREAAPRILAQLGTSRRTAPRLRVYA